MFSTFNDDFDLDYMDDDIENEILLADVVSELFDYTPELADLSVHSGIPASREFIY